MEFKRLVRDLRQAIETAADVSFSDSMPTPKWTRLPYSAELRKEYGDPRIHEFGKVIGYEVILTEFGKKPHSIRFSKTEEAIQERIAFAINRHLNGPRDLS